jgi:VWFA-related protein
MSKDKRYVAVILAAMPCAVFAGAQYLNAQQQNTQPANSSSPQQTLTQSASTDTIKARSQVVLLDVVATDKEGRPVTDLKPGDFTVTEQGAPQQLASYRLVDTAKHNVPNAAVTKLPPGVFTNRSQPMAEQRQLIVVLMDALNTPGADQSYARQEMLKYLAKHGAGQRIAIYGLTARLIRLQDFTDDPELLARVVGGQRGDSSMRENLAKGASPETVQAAQPDLKAEPKAKDAPKVVADPARVSIAQQVAAWEEEEASFEMDQRVKITLAALNAIAAQLSGYPGRKKLIWISSSFPFGLAPGDNANFRSERNYGTEISNAAAALRESRVSVYPIDPSGLMVSRSMQATFTPLGRNGREAPEQKASAQMKELEEESDRHFTGKDIAQQTAGLAFYNKNDVDDAIARSVADGATYYALSYSPTNKQYDGRVRHIDVKVNRPGVELRYRKSYVGVDPEKAPSKVKSATLQDVTPALNTVLISSALTFYASAQPSNAVAENSKRGMKQAEVMVLIEPRELVFAPQGDKKHCSIELFATAFYADKSSKSTHKQVERDLEPSRYEEMVKNGMIFRMAAEVPDGKSRVRVLVRDNISGKVGTVDVPYPPEIASAATVPAKN